MNSGLNGVQIGRGLKLSYDVVVVRSYGMVSLRLAQ